MRNSFLWRYRVVLTSGALLLISAHLLSVGTSPTSRFAGPQAWVLEAVAPVQFSTDRLFEATAALFHNYFDLLNVRRENEALRTQLAKLQSDRTRMTELEAENLRLSGLLELKDALAIDAVAAEVIGSDATGVSRALELARGAEGSLKPGMAVVSIDGVVGKIIAASPHASRVLLISDHNSALDAFDQRTRARGIIAGVVDDGLTMRYVDRSEDIRQGDPVVTSGLDGIFPRGLLVGYVARVRREGPGLFLSVDVRPAVDFRRLEQVLVITQQPPKLTEPLQG